MKNRPFLEAMADILNPFGLQCRSEGRQIVLYRGPSRQIK